MSDSLQPHGQQHARLPYPSPSPGIHFLDMLKLVSIKLVMSSNYLILCCLLLLLPSIFPSVRVSSSELASSLARYLTLGAYLNS